MFQCSVRTVQRRCNVTNTCRKLRHGNTAPEWLSCFVLFDLSQGFLRETSIAPVARMDASTSFAPRVDPGMTRTYESHRRLQGPNAEAPRLLEELSAGGLEANSHAHAHGPAGGQQPPQEQPSAKPTKKRSHKKHRKHKQASKHASKDRPAGSVEAERAEPVETKVHNVVAPPDSIAEVPGPS